MYIPSPDMKMPRS